jgi:eukaryotic-like serine/threonine-protein kinase
MGVVYKALDEKLERHVALKFLPPYIGSDQNLKQRLLQEAKAASALDHPNVGTIFGIEETPEGEIFIVMACYEGGTLAERLQRGPLPVNAALFYAVQALRGVAAAHAKSIVHRDIKPSNLFVTADGLLKILDFGLAKTTEAIHLTTEGTAVGTAAFMSPEQALGREAGPQSDLWSVGVVLYEMLAGRLPFAGQTQMSMLYQIAHEAYRPLDESVPVEIRRIVDRALSKNIAERYQNADEMLRELQAALSGIPLDSETKTLVLDTSSLRAASQVAAAAPAAKRQGTRWIAGALVAVLLMVVGAFAGQNLLRSILPAKWFGPSVRRLAVLPFRNIGNDPANAALCDGLEEILSARLAGAQNKKNGLVVIPAGEIRRRNIVSAADAWKQLGATVVVEGTVMRAGPGLQMTIDVVDAVKLSSINSVVLKDPVGDFTALGDGAADRVAEMLSVRAGNGQRPNTTPAASESYVKATGYLVRYDKPENLDKAIAEFENATRQDPRFALAYAGLAEACRLKYRIDKDSKWLQSATDNAKQAVALDGQLAPAYITLGRLYDGAGQKDLAIQELNTALRLDPLNADATLSLGTAYEHAGRTRDAETLYKKSINLRPDYWDGYNRLAQFYTKQGRYPEAEAQYRQAITYAPDNAILFGNFGVLLYNMQKREEARKMYQKSIEISPTYPSYSNLGELDMEDGRYAEAAQLYEKALKLNDRDYHVWTNLAAAYENSSGWNAKARGTLEHAADLAEAVRKERPQDSGVLADLATYDAKLGRKDVALQRLRQALALSPDDVDVLFWTSEAYEEMGMRDEALAGLRAAFQKGLGADRVEHDPEFKRLRTDARYIGMKKSPL